VEDKESCFKERQGAKSREVVYGCGGSEDDLGEAFRGRDKAGSREASSGEWSLPPFGCFKINVDVAVLGGVVAIA